MAAASNQASVEAQKEQPIARLHYFHGRGRAEQSRWMLAATSTPFINVCLSTPEDFQRLKNDGRLLFGQVPMLEIDGLQLVQSEAIVRHLARKHGLTGSGDKEAAVCDMVAEACDDFRNSVLGLPFGGNKMSCVGALKRYGPIFESMLEAAAASGSAFVAGGAGLTYADVMLAESVTSFMELLGDDLGGLDLKRLKEHQKRVSSLPGLAAYLGSPERFPFPAGTVGEAYARNVADVLSR